MDKSFEQYEREYLERLARSNSGSAAERAANAHTEPLAAVRDAAAGADLDSWDYVLLEMIRREDPRAAMRLGTMRSAESLLKLFCHGPIARRRPATFDERERMQAFLDSAEYRQYKNRLKRLMTREARERLELIAAVTGARDEKDSGNR